MKTKLFFVLLAFVIFTGCVSEPIVFKAIGFLSSGDPAGNENLFIASLKKMDGNILSYYDPTSMISNKEIGIITLDLQGIENRTITVITTPIKPFQEKVEKDSNGKEIIVKTGSSFSLVFEINWNVDEYYNLYYDTNVVRITGNDGTILDKRSLNNDIEKNVIASISWFSAQVERYYFASKGIGLEYLNSKDL
jgi:hypothetical protein